MKQMVGSIGGWQTMQMVHEMVGGEPYDYVPLGEYVVRAIGVCGGRPTFKYTRIEVAGALDRLASGESMEDIAAGYGGRVPREALQEAVVIGTADDVTIRPVQNWTV
jgi:uncharacterized protein (DUF433 family)